MWCVKDCWEFSQRRDTHLRFTFRLSTMKVNMVAFERCAVHGQGALLILIYWPLKLNFQWLLCWLSVNGWSVVRAWSVRGRNMCFYNYNQIPFFVWPLNFAYMYACLHRRKWLCAYATVEWVEQWGAFCTYVFYLVAKQRSIVILVFLSAFCPRGGAKWDVWIIEGGASMYMYLCAKHVAKLGGPGVCSPGKFLFWTFY